MSRVLVTGASGFIGQHLVAHLSQAGHEVTCLVRANSNIDGLNRWRARLVQGDVVAPDTLRRAVARQDVVYHLAGATKTLRRSDFYRINTAGIRNMAACCARQTTPPTLIVTSSLAAAGPSSPGRLRSERDPPAPVSHYGKSKLAGELAAAGFADRIPISIVRPPIVLGEGDAAGFAMFDGIARWGVHFVPSRSDHRFSVIHARDLAAALDLAAQVGRRLAGDEQSQGVYFVAADETPTYAELGRMIGRALTRTQVRVLRSPPAAVWTVAALSELTSRIRRRPHFLNLDKAREATAGSWTCDSQAIRCDTGFRPAEPLLRRLQQTAQWYVDAGWLRPRMASA